MHIFGTPDNWFTIYFNIHEILFNKADTSFKLNNEWYLYLKHGSFTKTFIISKGDRKEKMLFVNRSEAKVYCIKLRGGTVYFDICNWENVKFCPFLQ